jgi:hypothetical protein
MSETRTFIRWEGEVFLLSLPMPPLRHNPLLDPPIHNNRKASGENVYDNSAEYYLLPCRVRTSMIRRLWGGSEIILVLCERLINIPNMNCWKRLLHTILFSWCLKPCRRRREHQDRWI